MARPRCTTPTAATRAGQPTFDRVIRGLDYLKKHEVEFNALVTIHDANADHPLEVYRFLRDDLGIQFIQLIPIVERVVGMGADEAEADQPGEVVSHKSWRERPLYTQFGNAVTERSVTAEQYGRFLIAIFDEWVRRDVANVYVNMFDVALACWAGSRRASASLRRRAGRRWRWSTTATCTRAITLWSRRITWATSTIRP